MKTVKLKGIVIHKLYLDDIRLFNRCLNTLGMSSCHECCFDTFCAEKALRVAPEKTLKPGVKL